MGLEVASYIADLVATNPLSSDNVGQGDDHLRLLKSVLQGTFPNLGGRYGRVISGAAGYTVLSSDNTAIIAIPAASAATLTHTFSLPAVASVTAGFYVDIRAVSNGDVALVYPTGGASIEGAAFATVGPHSFARVFYDGTTWKVNQSPISDGDVPNYHFPGGVSISGALTLGSTLTISGTCRVGGNLSVVGTATFGSIVSILGTTNVVSLQVDGDLSVSGSVQVGNTLSVSGGAHFKTTVSIGGSAAIADGLSVSGAAHFNTTVSIGGAASLASTLSVSGGAHFNTTVSVAGAAILSSTLSVSGAAHFKTTVSMSGDATIGGTLSVSGAAHMKAALSVGGATTLGTTLSVSGAAHFNSTVSVGGAATLAATLTVSGTTAMKSLLDLQVGQIKFPASQNASADAKTLDDYEQGTWTPTLTCVTPGNLTIVYATRNGFYTKVGRMVSLTFEIETSTFTHTTASGNLQITGVPFTSLTSQPGQIGYSVGLTAVTSGAYMAILASTTISLYNVQPTTAATAQLSVTTNTTSGVQVRVISNIVHEV